MKVTIYEIASGKPSPAEWFRETPNCDTLKWLGRGIQPSRTTAFRFSAEHCRACPLRTQCTPNPEQGRTATRLEHEELLEVLRSRMATPEAKVLYRLRSRTVELGIADLKKHRSLRQFCSRGQALAHAQVGALALSDNFVAMLKL